MDQTQLEHELSIIKSMIEKTRNDTMESGSLFLFVGFGSIFFIGIVLVLEKMLLFTWIQPVMVALTILLGFVGFLVVRQREKQEKITTYTQRILLVL
ncbi:hypothetical protein KC799_25580, partial [candidate division KSB1 bacterium]|nr:hypothetical protein [candidate division KSB1 bacterium]